MRLAEEQPTAEAKVIAGLQLQFAAVTSEALQMKDRFAFGVDLHDQFGRQDYVVAGVALPKKQPVREEERNAVNKWKSIIGRIVAIKIEFRLFFQCNLCTTCGYDLCTTKYVLMYDLHRDL